METEGAEQIVLQEPDNIEFKTDPAPEVVKEKLPQGEGTEIVVEEKKVAAPVYTPNLKYKYTDLKTDAQQEKEFEDWIRPVIKDRDTEKKVRELFEKANGLDHTKNKNQTLRQERDSFKTAHDELATSVQTLSNMVRKGDLQTFFETLQIPEEQILRYVQGRLQYREMAPEQRSELDRQRNLQYQVEQLSTQNKTLLTQFQQTQVSQRESELNGTLSRPDVKSIADSFDARVGKPGAFRDEIIRRGQWHYAINKSDLPADQVVQEVISLIGGANSTPSQPSAPIIAPESKPIIPNIQGKSTSPVRKMPKSVADLKKLAQASAD